ncbi:MAG: Glyoxalase/bleomycin resistance protein/dioxygenase [Segetibacter sp.]|nr:Glyoxalase/bleomycin resistance protein/dioxygenase [Segetibacter sp.]
METNANALNWFEIPATDIERAKGFYENIFDIQMQTTNMMGIEMAFFPYTPGSGKASGALCKSEMHKPSQDGCIIYLNGNPDLQKALDKVEHAGGQIVMPKTKISDDVGYMAFIVDTEGNKTALHSQS